MAGNIISINTEKAKIAPDTDGFMFSTLTEKLLFFTRTDAMPLFSSISGSDIPKAMNLPNMLNGSSQRIKKVPERMHESAEAASRV